MTGGREDRRKFVGHWYWELRMRYVCIVNEGYRINMIDYDDKERLQNIPVVRTS